MTRRRSGNAVRALMERLGEVDSELEDLSIFDDATSPEALFDRLEEHARLRLEVVLATTPEGRRLRPIPADPDPAYIERLADYFESLQSHANEQRVSGARIAAEYAANDGMLATGQLRYAIEGRRLLAEGKNRAAVVLMHVCTRELHRYAGRLTPALASIRASKRVLQRRDDWDALGERRELRFRQLLTQGYTVAEAGRKIEMEEMSQTTSEKSAKGASVIRSLRRRFKQRGEAFPSPTRQAAKRDN